MQFGSTLGAKLVSCMLVGVLYGMVCAQCYSFFQRSHGRSSTGVMSLSVFLLWLLSTVHFIFSEMDTYLSLIGIVNSGEILNVSHWQLAAVDIVTLVTTLFVQCWYCHRMWILSRRNAFLVYILLIVIVLWFGFGMASCIEILMTRSLARYRSVLWLSLVSVSLTTFADFYIAASLCLILYRERKGVRQKTSSFLNTIIVYTVSTGLVTSVISVSYIIANLALPNTWVWVGEYMLFCGLYCNSLLAWINARDQFRERFDQNMGTGTLSAIVRRDLQPSTLRFAANPPPVSFADTGESTLEHGGSYFSGDDVSHPGRTSGEKNCTV